MITITGDLGHTKLLFSPLLPGELANSQPAQEVAATVVSSIKSIHNKQRGRAFDPATADLPSSAAAELQIQ